MSASDSASDDRPRTTDAWRLLTRGFGLPHIDVREFSPEDQDGAMPARAALSPDSIALVPRARSAADDLLQIATLAHAIGHLRYSPAAHDVGSRKPMLVAVLSLIEDARIERMMMRDYPGLRRVWGRFHAASTARYGDALTFTALAARLAHALHDPAYADRNHWVDKARTLFGALAGRLEDRAAFDDIASILANDLGQMRVRFDVHAYDVEPAYRDDNTFLWRFDDAQAQRVASMQQRGVDGAEQSGGAAESGMPRPAAMFRYPEWNDRSGTVREDWVTVIEGDAPGTARNDARPPLPRQSTPTPAHIPSGRRTKRERDGDDLDLDGVIEHATARRGGLPSSGRVFSRRRGRPRDASILLLLDLSASTARASGGRHATLLDAMRDAAERLCLTLDDAACRVAVHGFASNGRHEVRYVLLKPFAERYTGQHRQRLHASSPAWSTRIGAALRHAGEHLSREARAARAIVLMTDGEPSDIDVFDSRYLAADARHAAESLRAQRIRVHAMNFDPRADAEIRRIFGMRNSTTFSHTTDLSPLIERVVRRILA